MARQWRSRVPRIAAAAMLAVGTVLVTTPAAGAAPVGWTFTTVDFPGFASVNGPIGMNNVGDMVGYYDDAGGAWHGYVKLNGGPFTPVEFPGAITTVTLTINDNRDIVGVYVDQSGFQHGFRLSNGVYSSIDVPGAAQTRGVFFEFGPGLGSTAFGINRDGDIVGEYADERKVAHAYLLRDGRFTTIDPPDAPDHPGSESMAIRVSSHGHVVGSVNAGGWTAVRGFLWQDGGYTTIEHPDAGGSFGTQATGLNDHGDVVGSFTAVGANNFHGFALIQGRYVTIDHPGATSTEAYNINNSQTITGSYRGSDRRMHGYVGVRST